MIFVDLMTNPRPVTGEYSPTSYQSRTDELIWMKIASHNQRYKQDSYRCNISLLVMQLDAGVNEVRAESAMRFYGGASKHKFTLRLEMD